VHDNPAAPGGFVEGLVEAAETRLAVVGELALGVSMMDDQPQARPGTDGRVLEHLQVAVRVAERQYRLAADGAVDADGFASAVVDELDPGLFDQHRLAVAHLEFRDDAAADDLLGGDSVDLLGPRPHKLDPAAGDDKGLESFGAKPDQQLAHGLV